MATKNDGVHDGVATAREQVLDRSFDVLSDRHRRRVLLRLRTLSERRGEVAVAAVAATATDPERARITLRHQHLPKLEAENYVEWDHERGMLRPGDRFHEIEPVLDLVSDADDIAPRDEE